MTNHDMKHEKLYLWNLEQGLSYLSRCARERKNEILERVGFGGEEAIRLAHRYAGQEQAFEEAVVRIRAYRQKDKSPPFVADFSKTMGTVTSLHAVPSFEEWQQTMDFPKIEESKEQDFAVSF